MVVVGERAKTAVRSVTMEPADLRALLDDLRSRLDDARRFL